MRKSNKASLNWQKGTIQTLTLITITKQYHLHNLIVTQTHNQHIQNKQYKHNNLLKSNKHMIFSNNQTQGNFMIWKCFQIKYINKLNISIFIDRHNLNKIISSEDINKSEKLTLFSIR